MPIQTELNFIAEFYIKNMAEKWGKFVPNNINSETMEQIAVNTNCVCTGIDVKILRKILFLNFWLCGNIRLSRRIIVIWYSVAGKRWRIIFKRRVRTCWVQAWIFSFSPWFLRNIFCVESNQFPFSFQFLL